MIRRSLFPLAIGTTLLAIAAAAWAVSSPMKEWTIAGPFGGTAITVTIDPRNPNIVLAGAMESLLFQTQDSGAHWKPLNLPKRSLSEVTSILVDPADSNHYLVGVIAAEGGGLFESKDQGRTWATVKDIRDFGVRALAASTSDPSRFVAGTLRGVMLSADSGKTWKRISDPENAEMQGITAVAFDPKDPDIIYAGTSHLPWKTMDGGKTWQSIHAGMIDDSDVFSIYVDPANPSNVFASACSGVYASTDRGDLWRKLMGIPNTSRRTHVVRFESGACCGDPSDDALYAGTTLGLFRSLNRGTTWKTLSDTQVNSMAFDPSHPNNMFLALEYEGIGKSADGGATINLANNGFVDRVISAVTASGDKLWALETQESETTGLFVSGDRGESWSQLRGVRGLGGVHLKAIAGVSGQDRILLAASPRQMYKSIDAGLTWKPLPIRLIVNPPAEPVPPKAPARKIQSKPVPRTRSSRSTKPRIVTREISPSEISALYFTKSGTKDVVFAATDLGLLKSLNAGDNWTLANIPFSLAVGALYLAPNSDGCLIARTSGGLFISKDFGDHWAELPFPLPPGDVNEIAIPMNASCPLLVATRLGLYSSPDWGAKWYANLGGIPASTVSSVMYTDSEGTAYAVEYGRLYQTRFNQARSNQATNGGQSWEEIPTALPSLRIRQLWMPDISSNRIYGITSDLGILFRN